MFTFGEVSYVCLYGKNAFLISFRFLIYFILFLVAPYIQITERKGIVHIIDRIFQTDLENKCSSQRTPEFTFVDFSCKSHPLVTLFTYSCISHFFK